MLMFKEEFPFLAQATNMNAELIRLVGQNLTAYNVDVRIDYERWMEFEKEYGEWTTACSTRAKQNQESE